MYLKYYLEYVYLGKSIPLTPANVVESIIRTFLCSKILANIV